MKRLFHKEESLLTGTKQCSICKEVKSLDEFYSQIKKKSNGELYTYYQPYCKTCSSKKSSNWKSVHPERALELMHNYHYSETGKERKRIAKRKYRENGKQLEWQRNNKDKVSEYNENRKMNKTHEISKQEWKMCKKYFNDSCAYCGITEDDARKLYGQVLHKEHVEHEGSNDLSNCIPACKSCNSQKHTYELTEWYSENNDKFDQVKLNKIIKWLKEDYLKYKE